MKATLDNVTYSIYFEYGTVTSTATYTNQDGEPAIRCDSCGSVSSDPKHIAKRMCASCNRYHYKATDWTSCHFAKDGQVVATGSVSRYYTDAPNRDVARIEALKAAVNVFVPLAAPPGTPKNKMPAKLRALHEAQREKRRVIFDAYLTRAEPAMQKEIREYTEALVKKQVLAG